MFHLGIFIANIRRPGSTSTLDWNAHPLDLSSNTNLQTLEFDIGAILPIIWNSLPFIPAMLSTISSTRFSTTSIRLANFDEHVVPPATLSTIDGILDQSRFCSLSTVNIHVGSDAPQVTEGKFPKTVHSAVYAMMPKMVKKGVLQITHGDTRWH